MRKKRTQNQLILLALHYAILWEEWFIDSTKNSPDDEEARNSSIENVKEFKKLYEKRKNKP
jgi:hypothetical protein